ncbi:hypothetical protein ACIQU6_03310 [Streptomyces sp. NPDC090442]|uniref:hypothetical protein n=1 Tax=Streptomyces sp. NPDC090442 TaxID=3365962 RepID=UPI003802BCE3
MISKRHALTTIAVITAALGLSACTGSTISGQPGAPAGSMRPADPTPSVSTAIPSQPASTPNAQQTRDLIGALKRVSPAFGENEKWALTASRTICADIRAGQADSDVQEGAKLRFQGVPGTIKTVSDAQARRIVDAVKSSFCK